MSDQLELERLTSERMTRLETKVDSKLDMFSIKLDGIAEAVATMAGHFKTEKNFSSKINTGDNGNNRIIIALFISITLVIGGMLQQQVNFSRDFDQLTHKDTMEEILRIRMWKDTVEGTLPSHIKSSNAIQEILIKSNARLKDRLAYLTKQFFEFKTCGTLERRDQE